LSRLARKQSGGGTQWIERRKDCNGRKQCPGDASGCLSSVLQENERWKWHRYLVVGEGGKVEAGESFAQNRSYVLKRPVCSVHFKKADGEIAPGGS
jgi:hypothetical protein